MSFRVIMAAACPYPVPQGSQALLRETALALHSRGHEVHLLVYAHGIGAACEPFEVHRGPAVPGYRRTAAGPSWAKPIADLGLTLRLRAMLAERRPDVVHAHNYEGLLVSLLASRGSGLPIVYHAHNAMADELGYYLPPRRAMARLGRVLDRALPPRADWVIAPHERVAHYLVGCGCARDRTTVVPPAVFAEAIGASDRLPTVAPTMLYTGNLDAYQNLRQLGRICEAVRRRVPGAVLRVATAAPLDRVTAALGRAEGISHAATPDLLSLRAELACDAVAVCPRVSWSGYAIKVLNAMAAGLPVVAFASGAYPLRHLETGWVAPDDDVAAFTEGVVRLLSDAGLRRRLGDAARAAVIETHAPARIAEAIEGVYTQARAQASSRASRG